ncbi:hypothetical protein QQ045_007246 [Rhodiola kirilowii]
MKYLDKMDAEKNKTPEPVEEDEEKDDPGSGEVAGSDRPFTTEEGHSSVAAEGIVDVHRDEESDTDDEETENMRIGQSDRFWMEEEEEKKKENSSGKEIDEEGWEDDELVEAYEVIDRDDEDDVVEYDEGDDEDDEEEEKVEVDNEEQDLGSASNKEKVTFTEGEIDGHDQGDDGADEDDNGETGEKDEHGVGEVGYEVKDWAEEDHDEEENGSGYMVQPAIQPLDIADDNGDVSRDSHIKPVNDEENEEENGNDDLDVEEDMMLKTIWSMIIREGQNKKQKTKKGIDRERMTSIVGGERTPHHLSQW